MADILLVSPIDPTYPAYPICASIGIVLVLLPAYWQFKTKNVGTIAYTTWTLVGNLNYLVNSIAWKGNIHDTQWIWCDFSTAIIVALNVAIPVSTLLITRNLASASAICQVKTSKSRKTMYSEITVSIGVPFLAVIAHIVVQGHRFNIFENIGKTVLTSASSGLQFNTYLRLIALAATEILFSLPFRSYMLFLKLEDELYPWVSWADTHYNFNRVEKRPYGWVTAYPGFLTQVNVSRYSLPLGSLLFFLYVGLAGESGMFYRRQCWRLAKCLGIPGPSEAALSTPGMSLPPRVTASSQLRASSPANVTQSNASSQDEVNLGLVGKQKPSFHLLSMPPCLCEEGWLEAELAHLG
ncbi:a-factor receptor, partial [Tulasnella sp. 427]